MDTAGCASSEADTIDGAAQHWSSDCDAVGLADGGVPRNVSRSRKRSDRKGS